MKCLVSFFFFKGALTNKPFAFKARAWELTTVKTYDIFDSLLQTINVNIRGLNILRILPAETENMEMSWISDKTRFFFDSLKYQRILNPFLIIKNKTYNISWNKVLNLSFLYLKEYKKVQFFNCFFKLGLALKELLPLNNCFFVSNPFLDLRSLNFFKNLNYQLGNVITFDDSPIKNNENYIEGVEKLKLIFLSKEDLAKASFVFLVGLDLRYEIPSLNLLFRNLVKYKKLKVFCIGSRGFSFNKNNFYFVDNNLKTFLKIMEGRHWLNNLIVKEQSIEKNFIFLGESCLAWFTSYIKKNNKSLNFFCEKYNFLFKVLFKIASKINTNLFFLENKKNILFKKIIYNNYQETNNLIFNTNLVKFKQNKNSLIFNLNPFNSLTRSMVEQMQINLPIATVYEKKSFFFDIFGKLKQLTLVSLPPVYHVRESKVRTESRVFNIFFLLIKTELTKELQIKRDFGFNFITNNFLPLVKSNMQSARNVFYFDTKMITKVNCLNFFICNFFETDSLSKMSKILRINSSFFYRQLNNYE